MRCRFAAFAMLTLLSACGYDPHPKDGKLPCTEGCPSGYVCRTDNRCWRTNAPVVDSGADGPAVAKDVATADIGGTDIPGTVDAVSPEAGREVSVDTSLPGDVVVAVDLASADTATPIDTAGIDSAGGSAIDAPIGTTGAGGNGGASGSGGASGAGGASGSGGAIGTGGTSGSGGASGSGGTGGSNADAAPDAPQGNTDAACVPETDQQMCTRLGKNCNAISGTDNCGQSRSITTCGTCTGTLVCGAFVANVCPTVCIFDQSTFDNCVFGP
jgi:hypothetical protein